MTPFVSVHPSRANLNIAMSPPVASHSREWLRIASFARLRQSDPEANRSVRRQGILELARDLKLPTGGLPAHQQVMLAAWLAIVGIGPGGAAYADDAIRRYAVQFKQVEAVEGIASSSEDWPSAATDTLTPTWSLIGRVRHVLPRKPHGQGRRCQRPALGIKSSVCLALRAEVVKLLAGFAVRLLALATISLAEVAAA